MAAMVGARLVETLISVVVFVGDAAYKVKKPVRLDYVDLSTLEARRRLCVREVELNRRLAPDVYLGVADVHGPDGAVCEHMVVMRRMPADRRLATLIARSGGVGLDGCLDELARLLVVFHAAAERGPHVDAMATATAVGRRWADNFASMRPFAGEVFDGADLDRAEQLAHAFARGREEVFDERVGSGRACDGHGDLQCADVFCLDDGPRVLDCIEFDDSLRYSDVAEDLAFLLMDLERLGAPDAAVRLRRRYEELAGDVFPPPLLHLYIAYRAQVRAKVAALRWEQNASDDSRDEARQLLALCLRHLERTRVRLVLVGGLPGTGKTTLARGIAAALGAALVRTDEVRDAIAAGEGAPAATGYREGIHSAETTDAVYRDVLGVAETALARGVPVVLDASWSDERQRHLARDLADRAGAELVELRCAVDAETAAERIRARLAAGTDVSRATPEVAALMAADADPWPEAVTVDTAAEPGAVVAAALGVLGVPRG